MVIFAGNNGALDQIPTSQVQAWEKAFLQFVRDQKAAVRTQIAEKKELTDELKNALKGIISEFNATWKPGGK
jgi:F-type H+-transporting ATPase subunit alpha